MLRKLQSFTARCSAAQQGDAYQVLCDRDVHCTNISAGSKATQGPWKMWRKLANHVGTRRPSCSCITSPGVDSAIYSRPCTVLIERKVEDVGNSENYMHSRNIRTMRLLLACLLCQAWAHSWVERMNTAAGRQLQLASVGYARGNGMLLGPHVGHCSNEDSSPDGFRLQR